MVSKMRTDQPAPSAMPSANVVEDQKNNASDKMQITDQQQQNNNQAEQKTTRVTLHVDVSSGTLLDSQLLELEAPETNLHSAYQASARFNKFHAENSNNTGVNNGNVFGEKASKIKLT